MKLVTSYVLFYAGLFAMNVAGWLGSAPARLARRRAQAGQRPGFERNRPEEEEAPLATRARKSRKRKKSRPAALCAKDDAKKAELKPKAADPIIGNDPVIEIPGREQGDPKKKKDKAEPAGATAHPRGGS